MTSFLAFRIERTPSGVRAEPTGMTVDSLSPGDVLIRARWSGINYKDALAASPDGRVLRRSPLNGGIDVAGHVEHSDDPRFRPGDQVLVTGQGLGESHDGGFAQYVRVPADWVVALPAGLTLREAMALGTAGFTAALAVHQLMHNGQAPASGTVAVTGATGGVGSLAVTMLAALGFRVCAITGKADGETWLRSLGATDVLLRQDLEPADRPLARVRFAGAVDNLGGGLLAWLLSVTARYGNVASVGLAADAALHTTVMPFILRGVNLLGINSVHTPRPLRERIWQRLAGDLKPAALPAIATREIGLGELAALLPLQLTGRLTGRTLVRLD